MQSHSGRSIGNVDLLFTDFNCCLCRGAACPKAWENRRNDSMGQVKNNDSFLGKAEKLKPVLKHRMLRPVGVVSFERKKGGASQGRSAFVFRGVFYGGGHRFHKGIRRPAILCGVICGGTIGFVQRHMVVDGPPGSCKRLPSHRYSVCRPLFRRSWRRSCRTPPHSRSWRR